MVKAGQWTKRLEDSINIQINYEMQAFYEYNNISMYFKRGSVGLDKLSHYFKKMSDEEKDHADMFSEYQLKRGGEVLLKELSVPQFNIEKNDVLEAFEKSLEMEKKIYDNLINLDILAETEKDPHLSDFIESTFLVEQIDSIYELNKIISNIKRIDNNKDLWLFINTYNFES